MKRPKQRKTIRELIQEYFQQHPNTDLPHRPVVDWGTEQWRLQGNETPPREPWRMTRRLHEGDQKMVEFCREVLSVYERHGVNDHIRWE